MRRTKRVTPHAKPDAEKQTQARNSGRLAGPAADAEWFGIADEECYMFVGPIVNKPLFISEPQEKAA